MTKLLPLATWFACSVIAVAQESVDHGQALVDWLKKAEGSFFHPNLEIRNRGGGSYGMFATANIAAKELMIRIPRDLLIAPLEEPRLKDRVFRYFEETDETFDAYINSVDEDGNFELIFDDGERVFEVDEDDFEFYTICKTVQMVLDQTKLGKESELAPYINYLNGQPRGQLPTAWSKAGKDHLFEILGRFPKEDEILPPFGSVDLLTQYHEVCKSKDPEEENAYLLLLQRGWDDLFIPVYDMMSHGNGRWLNTESDSVLDEDTPIVVRASRDIPAGEEIYSSYNFCHDCGGRRLYYGTPELLRDYGFVEKYPQRWAFGRQQTIFDLDEVYDEDGKPTGELKLEWVKDGPDEYSLSSEYVGFFVEQLQRLEDLGETVFATKDPNVPDSEWDVLVEFRSAMATAIRTALQKAGHETKQSCEEGSCIVNSPHYEPLQREVGEYWSNFRPETCNPNKEFGPAFWYSMEVIHSPYQRITFLANPTLDPIDTCFMLDLIWQTCTCYRPHYHEMVVHFTSRYIEKLQRVLFVGGGDSMLLHDVIKYPTLEKIVGLEIDQQVTRGAFKYFGSHPHFFDERVEWWYGDAAKSMLMLPKEYYGSFDLVLVDLSETAASLTVTDKLDVMEALSLLIKPTGILVKNEYNYFPKQREVFHHALHVHYYNVPIVCSQSLILGSHGVDFLRADYRDHGIDHLYDLLDAPDLRHGISRDYQRNYTNPQIFCIDTEQYQEEFTKQKRSPGVTMIIEAEEAKRDLLESSGALSNVITKTLSDLGFSVMKTITSEFAKLPLVFLMLGEGFVVARAWPEDRYCALDFHLWSRFTMHNDARKTLITALGSSVEGPSSSTYRIVSGGMFGISTWVEDYKNRGPTLDECNATNQNDKKVISNRIEMQESTVLSIVQEGMSLVQNETSFVVGIICGPQDQPCNAIDAMKKVDRVRQVVPLHACASLVKGVEFMEDSVSRMQSCEKETWKYLQSAVADEGKKIRAIVVDSSAEYAFTSVVQAIVKSHVNKDRFLAENVTVIAPFVHDKSPWKQVFVDSFRKVITMDEPSFKAEIYFNSTSDNSFAEIALSSSGDVLFYEHMIQFTEQVEKKLNLVSEITNVRGGDFVYQDPFVAKTFTDKDFDQAAQLKLWESQKPMGLQVLFQLELASGDQRVVSFSLEVFKIALKVTLTRALEHDDWTVQEFKEVGDGGVLVAIWADGHAVLLWDGRVHVDINLFLYEEDIQFTEEFEENVLKELPMMKTVLCDVQPRGMGRVVNFARDLKDGTKPRWI